MKNNNSNFRFFIYKTLFILICGYLFYNFTIGKTIDLYEKKLLYFVSDQGREKVRDKLRDEISKSLERENLLNYDDRILLKRLINKISSELNNQD